MTQLTGVFVRLPLSGDQVQALENRICEYEDALIAIGTPVTGGELEVVGYADPEDLPLSDGGPTNWTADINAKPDDECTVALVRLPDALSKLAEKDAENTKLRDLLERLRDVVSRGMTQSVPLPGQQYPIGSHHHPIWVEIANALEGPGA